jgi:hypothetical protein
MGFDDDFLEQVSRGYLVTLTLFVFQSEIVLKSLGKGGK